MDSGKNRDVFSTKIFKTNKKWVQWQSATSRSFAFKAVKDVFLSHKRSQNTGVLFCVQREMTLEVAVSNYPEPVHDYISF